MLRFEKKQVLPLVRAGNRFYRFFNLPAPAVFKKIPHKHDYRVVRMLIHQLHRFKLAHHVRVEHKILECGPLGRPGLGQGFCDLLPRGG